jgi:hypothetical protein
VIWFVFLVMCLGAYRLTRLIVRDTFPPVLWLRDRLAGGWRKLTVAESEEYAASRERGALIKSWELDPKDLQQRYVRRARWSPPWLAELITCPWCASAYVSGALTAAVDVLYGVPVPWLVGPAVWAVSALLASREWA